MPLTKDSTPEEVVKAQFEAYNANDAEALVATYAEDAQLFQHPSTLMVAGAAQILERFKGRFAVSKPRSTASSPATW